MIPLRHYRKKLKITAKSTGLDPRTVAKIDSGDYDHVSVASLKKYLDSIGLKLTISLENNI